MTPRTAKIFFLAGEPSGDRIGADLLQRLQERINLTPIGVGGSEMTHEGLNSFFPMSDLSVMGFSDVIRRLPLLLWRIRQTARRIIKECPDVVVLIDSQVFSALLAKRLRALGYRLPIILYVAPAVWAWKPERAPKLKPLFDEVLAVLPFEPKAMTQLDGPKTSYVGHPALSAIPKAVVMPKGKGLLALLPGSRAGEIRRHMPLLKQLVARLADHPNVTGFILPTLPHLAHSMREEVLGWVAPIDVLETREARDKALEKTYGAIVTAGTITLELALTGIPMVGTYVPDKRLMHHYEKAGRPMIGLPNIILDRRVIPEIAPGPEMADNLMAASMNLLENSSARKEQLNAFSQLRALMENGAEGAPRQDPADRILTHLH